MAGRRRNLRKDLGLSTAAFVFLVGSGFVGYLFFGHPTFIISLVGLILFFLFIVKMDRTIVPVMDELMLCEGNAARGANAEEKIGALLDQLSPDYLVWHGVKTDGGDIDHLAFRKDGAVFLIETKSHHGKITQQDGQLRRDGQPLEKNFIGQAHRNVYWLKEFLKARSGFEPKWIHAAIVFSNAYVEKHLEIKGVAVMNARFLSEWIRRQSGDPQAGAMFWPEIKKLKVELPSPAPNHLAPLPALR